MVCGAAAALGVVLLVPSHALQDASAPRQQVARWVLITGANKGIGHELAVQLLREGHPVIAACRTQQTAEAAAKSLRAAAGASAQVQPLQLDVASRSSIAAAVQRLRAEYDQRLYCLVNNAGINTMSWSQRGWDAEYAVNFDGPVHLAEQLAPILRPGGRVINVSSSLGQLGPGPTEYGGMPSDAYRSAIAGAASLQGLRAIGFDGSDAAMVQAARHSQYPCPAYRATKAMLNRATQLMAQDERFTARGITVCCVCPGSVQTDMNPFGRSSAAEGAASIAWLVNHPQPLRTHGRFWCKGQQLPF